MSSHERALPPLLQLDQASRDFSIDGEGALDWTRRVLRRQAAPRLHAVDRFDLSIHAGEVVGLIGESGSGKSTLGRLAAGLLPLSSGRRLVADALGGATPTPLQRVQVQMVFQDASAALNPRMRVLDLVGEAPLVHGLVTRSEQRRHVTALLQRVGLDETALARYAHQFSGGQRARIGLARALALAPAVLILDEAVASLDVSIQAQMLNLFLELRRALNLSYLFISHDLGVVRYLADRVLIMYLGRIVESAPAAELFAAPNHPYAQGLLAQAPSLKVEKRVFQVVKGEIPSPLDPPSGCRFHPRCPEVMPVCKIEDPALVEIAPGRFSACHLNRIENARSAAPQGH